ncbi:MAG: CDP-alcohol phosphatidyltransferase family protein [Raoultibacter sp.]
MKQGDTPQNDSSSEELVIDKIFTIPNVISMVRLCLVPVFLVLLMNGNDIAAALLFALAAGTDFLDGQIARRTNTVSKLGQLLDPAIDRILMIAGVGGLLLVGRLPLWIVAVVLIRDLFLLVGGSVLLKRYHIRIPVVYLGKVATTFLFVGFAGALLNWPLISGLGLCTFSWLPGFNTQMCSWGIWFIYVGLILSLITTVVYVMQALRRLKHVDEQAEAEIL